jgi:hypothetical protein
LLRTHSARRAVSISGVTEERSPEKTEKDHVESQRIVLILIWEECAEEGVSFNVAHECSAR